MAEIKSTIELMMERTSGMRLSDEEKRKIHEDELMKRARGLTNKLVEGSGRPEDVTALLSEGSQEDRELLESHIWNGLIDTMPRDRSALKHLEILEQLPRAKEKQAELEEARAALKTSEKDRAKDRSKLVTKERKKLASFGISGSAVIPKISDVPDTNFSAAVEKLRTEAGA